MKVFEVGKQYEMRSACDHECVWAYTVTARTAQVITLADECGKVIRCRISQQTSRYFDREAVRPLGSYSMAPILLA